MDLDTFGGEYLSQNKYSITDGNRNHHLSNGHFNLYHDTISDRIFLEIDDLERDHIIGRSDPVCIVHSQAEGIVNLEWRIVGSSSFKKYEGSLEFRNNVDEVEVQLLGGPGYGNTYERLLRSRWRRPGSTSFGNDYSSLARGLEMARRLWDQSEPCMSARGRRSGADRVGSYSRSSGGSWRPELDPYEFLSHFRVVTSTISGYDSKPRACNINQPAQARRGRDVAEAETKKRMLQSRKSSKKHFWHKWSLCAHTDLSCLPNEKTTKIAR